MESSHSQPSDNGQSANPLPGSQPPAAQKKTTILDLARFRIGQRAYWIVFRSEARYEFRSAPEWMREEHPWMLWRYRIMPWSVPLKPPRTHPADTLAIMMLCGQKPKIEPFRIADVVRSENSGTFLYTSQSGMVMPEGLLFPTKKAARREIARIAKVFAAWTGTWEEGAMDEPPKSG
jgi:hypothetical protein